MEPEPRTSRPRARSTSSEQTTSVAPSAVWKRSRRTPGCVVRAPEVTRSATEIHPTPGAERLSAGAATSATTSRNLPDVGWARCARSRCTARTSAAADIDIVSPSRCGLTPGRTSASFVASKCTMLTGRETAYACELAMGADDRPATTSPIRRSVLAGLRSAPVMSLTSAELPSARGDD